MLVHLDHPFAQLCLNLELTHFLVSCQHLIPVPPIILVQSSQRVSPFVRLLQSGWIRFGNLQQHPHGIELVVRWFDLGELDQSDSQGPDISFVVIRSIFHGFTHHHLRGHPEHKRRKSRLRALIIYTHNLTAGSRWLFCMLTPNALVKWSGCQKNSLNLLVQIPNGFFPGFMWLYHETFQRAKINFKAQNLSGLTVGCWQNIDCGETRLCLAPVKG